MFRVQARGSRSSMSVGTDGPLAALAKMDELGDDGMKDVTVLSAQGQELTREELEALARTESQPG